MVKRAAVLLGLVLALTCGPTAIPLSGGSPSPTVAPIASSDLITLREGGQQPVLSVRKVATAELVRNVADGLLLPDGKTILSVERGATQTTVRTMSRITGAVTRTTVVAGAWELMRGWPTYAGASPDATHVVLFGRSYNATDQNGAWTALTTFGVLDVATGHLEPIELSGHYGFEAVSNDGRLVYLAEYTENDANTRVYDVSTHQMRDVARGALFESARYAGGFAFGMVSMREETHPAPDTIQITTVNKLARLDLATGSFASVVLPSRTPSGEDALAWSMLPARDGHTLFVVNPLLAVVAEIDIASLTVLRTTTLAVASGPLDAIFAALHPVALGKMEFLQGAIFSPDGTKIYALALNGIWSIDVASLQATMLARTGGFISLKASPDGARLYAIARENGTVSAIDARTGAMLGTMPRTAVPSDIVAVDAG